MPSNNVAYYESCIVHLLSYLDNVDYARDMVFVSQHLVRERRYCNGCSFVVLTTQTLHWMQTLLLEYFGILVEGSFVVYGEQKHTLERADSDWQPNTVLQDQRYDHKRYVLQRCQHIHANKHDHPILKRTRSARC
jgi:hypothetical protein